ncbi:F-box domain-containing protein [Entamoeba marina]
MVILENIYIKNVLFYLPTMKDIKTFQMVSKKCNLAIQTVFINPFQLSETCTFEEIIDFFPSLQTFYCTDCLSRLYKKNANELPLIEVGKWRKRSKMNEVFKTQWFASKVRKIRIMNSCLGDIIKNIDKYTQLQVVKCNTFMIPNIAKIIFNIPTLKKCTAYFNLLSICKSSISVIDMEKMSNTQYCFFILNPKQVNTKTAINDKNLPNNIKIYFSQFIKTNENVNYLPCDMSDSTYTSLQLPHITHKNKKEIIEWIISHDCLEITVNNSLESLDLSLAFLLVKVNLCFVKSNVTLPTTLKELTIGSSQLSVNIKDLKLSKFICTRSTIQQPATINIEKLSTFIFNYSTGITGFETRKTGFTNTFVINDFTKKIEIIFKKGKDNPFEFCLEDTSKFKLEKFFEFVFVRNETLMIRRPPKSFSALNFEQFHFKNIKLHLVRLNTIKFSGIISELRLKTCSIENLYVHTVQMYKLTRSRINNLYYVEGKTPQTSIYMVQKCHKIR